MGKIYANFHLNGPEDLEVKLRELKECGKWSLSIGGIYLTIISNLETLNALGWEIERITKNEKEKIAAELKAVGR